MLTIFHIAMWDVKFHFEALDSSVSEHTIKCVRLGHAEQPVVKVVKDV